jgi:hypothetical protein
MAKVGALNVTSMPDNLQGPRKEVTVYKRAGVAGHGLVVSAPHGVQQQIRTILVSTLAGCLSQFGAAESLVGSVVSITDSTGVTFANCSILDVRGVTQAVGGVPGADTMLTLTWDIVVEA